MHRSLLPPVDVVRRGGLPVTTRWRTAFDLGRQDDPVAAVVALDALLHGRVVSIAALHDMAVGRTGWRGVTRFREAVRLARPGAESPMESRVRLVVVRGGLPEPALQVRVFDSTGRFIARLDMAYEAARIGLEFDGDHHRDRAIFQRDAVRINQLRLAGWTVLRFTADDVLRHSQRLVAQVAAALKSPPLKIATSGAESRL
jgi:very-short-patch-repair endonuclease